MTPAQAFSNAPASTEKSSLITAFDSVLTAIDAAATAGAFTTIAAGQLKSEVVDVAETIAANMTDHH